ncbi:hypothetical protein OTU49_009572 [Cherax quadricarinatus]|uniref:Uncharacterized protein n=1 Tax=Cherax quadricarinatus TaxID=27406 RepID=A0AAW0W9Q0_CHEQU
MPAVSGSYQYTWSVASPVAPNNSLASARQVNFPALSSQPQQCYLPNSVAQLSPQNFPHVAPSLRPTASDYHVCNTLSQPLYQNQCTNSSLSSLSSEHQKVSPIHTTSAMSQTTPLSTSSSSSSSLPTSQHVTSSNLTSTTQQVLTAIPSTDVLQSNYAPKPVQHILMVTPSPNTSHSSYSPNIHISPTRRVSDKNSSALSASQLTNQKSEATGQTYMPM